MFLICSETFLRTHCCRHKCFPICTRAQHLLRTQILCPRHKNVSDLFRNILCLQQMFPSLRAQGNVMSNNVSARACHVIYFKRAHRVETEQNIELMTFALTWCVNIFIGCSVTLTFFRQSTSFPNFFSII